MKDEEVCTVTKLSPGLRLDYLNTRYRPSPYSLYFMSMRMYRYINFTLPFFVHHNCTSLAQKS